ncbi:hypothetical protein AAY473_012783 [Plecturocebus cupreus]
MKKPQVEFPRAGSQPQACPDGHPPGERHQEGGSLGMLEVGFGFPLLSLGGLHCPLGTCLDIIDLLTISILWEASAMCGHICPTLDSPLCLFACVSGRSVEMQEHLGFGDWGRPFLCQGNRKEEVGSWISEFSADTIPAGTLKLLLHQEPNQEMTQGGPQHRTLSCSALGLAQSPFPLLPLSPHPCLGHHISHGVTMLECSGMTQLTHSTHKEDIDIFLAQYSSDVTFLPGSANRPGDSWQRSHMGHQRNSFVWHGCFASAPVRRFSVQSIQGGQAWLVPSPQGKQQLEALRTESFTASTANPGRSGSEGKGHLPKEN